MVFPSGQREKVFSLSKSIDLHFSENCTSRLCIRKSRISLVHINPPKSFYTYDFKEKCLHKGWFPLGVDCQRSVKILCLFMLNNFTG